MVKTPFISTYPNNQMQLQELLKVENSWVNVVSCCVSNLDPMRILQIHATLDALLPSDSNLLFFYVLLEVGLDWN